MELIENFLTQNPCYLANVAQAEPSYAAFQAAGPRGLMLHSVGCAQPRAEVFCRNWNRPDYDRACVHAFIDAKTGEIRQTLPWYFRGWHCGGSANDTHIGVELCETNAIRYGSGDRFTVTNRKTALADCERSYQAAVELFAFLCVKYALDPLTAICSHKEGGKAGVASGHTDPEHYWSGLGTDHSMAGFRADVAAAMRQSPGPNPDEIPAEPAPTVGGGSPDPNPAEEPSGPIYRIQVGAFRNRAYAEDFLRQVQTHFPEAFLKTETR